MSEAQSLSRRKVTALWCLMGVIMLLILEASAFALIWVANGSGREPILRRQALFDQQSQLLSRIIDGASRDQFHETLGWQYRPGFAGNMDTVNAMGLRAAREYSEARPEGALPRVAAFGDSFVYCSEVSNDACWSSILESGWSTEVLNYGVGGYGTDQALLRYREEGERLSPDVVLIGFAPINLRRAVNRYRRFISAHEGPWFKPRFLLVDDELRLLPPPVGSIETARALRDNPAMVTSFGEDDHWYQPAVYEHLLHDWSAAYRVATRIKSVLDRRYFDEERLYEADGGFRTESPAFPLQVRLLEQFRSEVAERGARPIVLYLPSGEDVALARTGAPVTYAPLKEALEALGAESLDPIDDLADATGEVLFAPGGHYSRRGNTVLAEVIARHLAYEARIDPR